MAWRLEIHHIDVVSSGDSTLIVAREVPPLAGAAPVIRSVLIDGGRRNRFPIVHAYVGAVLGPGVGLSALICTHYDVDHMGGLTPLLLMPGRYNNTVVYDQGWAGAAGVDVTYLRYIRAINGLNDNGPVPILAGILARNRMTATVQADGVPPLAVPGGLGPPAVPGGGLGAIVDAPDWLLNGMGAPAEILWTGPGAGGVIPPGAPTMRFIAANKYVRTVGGGVGGPFAGGIGADPRNEKSLAVEVTFGNFRYYTGGDVETAQENQIQLLLNNANNAAGRVLAMKASHHGANTATSRAFVNQVRPEVAVLSVGTANQYLHPVQETVNVLDGYPPLLVPHPAPPTLPPDLPVANYLTGYQNPAVMPPQTLGGDMSMTAGDPTVFPEIPGHIEVEVTALQSATPVEGEVYRAVEAAVLATLTAAALAGALGAGAAGPVAVTVAEEALVHGPGPAADAVINQVGGPVVAGTAALAAANGPIPGGNPAVTMANLVATAALNNGAAAAHAAAAGAAAGAYYGGGTAAAVQIAVYAGLRRAGLSQAAATPIALGATAALPAPTPTFFGVRFYDLITGAWVTHTHQ